ncbi:unnamed protein product [Symbiodinium natans]|uniref:Uncharacterized protein n=1 Tax=Symbiodinium natans TaxID=878477 RepID=A0A812Q2V3_9DINO|nr:unnamed protein product [Symbiodinium natans]
MGGIESCCGPRQRLQEAPPSEWLDSAARQPAAQEAKGHRPHATEQEEAASCPWDPEPRGEGEEEQEEVLRLVERSTFLTYEPVAPPHVALQRSRSEPGFLSACEKSIDAGQEFQKPQEPQQPEPQPAQLGPGKSYEHIHAYGPCHPTDSPFEPPAYGELPAWAWEQRAVRRRTPRFKLLNAIRQPNGETKWVPFP